MNKKVIVIGGGPAGVEAAVEAAKVGASVTIVNDGPVGGRAGWHSLLPSKVWLAAAGNVGELEEMGESPRRKFVPNRKPSGVVRRIAETKRSWNHTLEITLDKVGVEVVQGTASFVSDKNIEIRDASGGKVSTLEADAFIAASGSVPVFPPALKPDGRRVIAPRFSSQLNRLPKSMIVVGAGPTGCESAFMFNQFGVDVTWIVDQFGILPEMHRDLGYNLGREMVRQGVHVIQGQMVDRLDHETQITAVLADGSRYSADMAFVAIGRKPDWARLNLGAIGVDPDSGQVQIDEYGRVEGKSIYLVGDAAGGALIANKAMAQARIAGRHAAGAPANAYNPNLIVHVAYTEPQAAQIGTVGASDGVKSVRVPFSAALKTHLLEAQDGFIELFYSESDRKVLGAIALGHHAADVLTPIALALKVDATIDQLADIFAPHPSISELAFIAARAI